MVSVHCRCHDMSSLARRSVEPRLRNLDIPLLGFKELVTRQEERQST
jgi:hypothetical protein